VTQQPSLLRIASQWVIAALLAAVLAALFILIAAVQLSSEETAIKAHRRAVATLTEIDRLLPRIEDELENTNVPAGETVPVPGFPIPVQLTADETDTLRGAELREQILDGAAKLVYEDGMDSWSGADRDGVQRIERISAAGAVDTGLGLATESRHRLFVAGAVLLGVVALALAAGLMLAVRDWNMRLVALGSVIIAAGLPSLAAAIAARFAFKTAQTDADPFVEELLDIGVDAAWVPIRDYLILSALGFVVAGLGALGAWLQGRPARQAAMPAAPTVE
jgi:phosphate/sulfate permease